MVTETIKTLNVRTLLLSGLFRANTSGRTSDQGESMTLLGEEIFLEEEILRRFGYRPTSTVLISVKCAWSLTLKLQPQNTLKPRYKEKDNKQ